MDKSSFEYTMFKEDNIIEGWKVLDVTTTSTCQEVWYGKYMFRPLCEGQLRPIFITIVQWNPYATDKSGYFVKTSRYANPSCELYKYTDMERAKKRAIELMKRTENHLKKIDSRNKKQIEESYE